MYKKSNPVTRLRTSDFGNVWIRGRYLGDNPLGHLPEEQTESAGYHIWKTADEAVPYQQS